MGYHIRLPLYAGLFILPFVVRPARRGRQLPFTVPGALTPPSSKLETKSSLAPSQPYPSRPVIMSTKSTPNSPRFFGAQFLRSLSLPRSLLTTAMTGMTMISLCVPANADITVLGQQIGSDVVFSYSGSVNLTGLSSTGSGLSNNIIFPSVGLFATDNGGALDGYTFTPFAGIPFGSGGGSLPH